MATKNKDLYEIVMETKPKQARAFMAGLQIGLGDNEPVWFNHEEGIHHEGLAEKLAESAHLRPRDCHLITTGVLRDILKKHDKRLLAEGGIRLVRARKVRGAKLAFQFQAFAKQYGDEIMAVFGDLPADVKVRGFKPCEKINPKAEGIEGYAPVHDYELCGKGEISGPVDAVLAVRNRLAELPLVKMKKIKLTLA